jgi:hypothetical protein
MANDEILWEKTDRPGYVDSLMPGQISDRPKAPASCPHCHSQDIRVSHSTKILDFFARLFLNRVPFRCRNCHLRFYRQDPQLSTVLADAAAVRRWTDRLPKRRKI